MSLHCLGKTIYVKGWVYTNRLYHVAPIGGGYYAPSTIQCSDCDRIVYLAIWINSIITSSFSRSARVRWQWLLQNRESVITRTTKQKWKAYKEQHTSDYSSTPHRFLSCRKPLQQSRRVYPFCDPLHPSTNEFPSKGRINVDLRIKREGHSSAQGTPLVWRLLIPLKEGSLFVPLLEAQSIEDEMENEGIPLFSRIMENHSEVDSPLLIDANQVHWTRISDEPSNSCGEGERIIWLVRTERLLLSW